jgi:Meiotically Up-regulated Gene 113 (MUG113) protein
MTKQHILDEIKRTSAANGGAPLGTRIFFRETGIRETDWYGKYWSRWSDACNEAGFAPNTRTERLGKEFLMEQLVALVRELGKMPVVAELRLKRRRDPSFPGTKSLYKNLGTMNRIRAEILVYCRNHSGLEDVAQILSKNASREEQVRGESLRSTTIGYVYLLKSGRRYKIGRTNAVGRREYELGTKLPDESRTIQAIPTDDPAGIENYWHNRSSAKRTRGEWFELDSSDVQAFKRWKHM